MQAPHPTWNARRMEARLPLKLLFGALIIALATTACSPAAPSQSQAGPADGSPLVIEQVIISGKGEGADSPRAALKPGQPLVLGIRTSRSAKDSMMEAKVFALATGQIQEKRLERFEDDATLKELDLDGAKGWSEGRYLVEIRLDGKLAAQQEFDLIDIPTEAPRP